MAAAGLQPVAILGDAAFLVMQSIQIGKAAVNHKDNCRRLVDRLKLLLPLLEDVKHAEIANDLAAAATFERLRISLEKAKDVLESCNQNNNRVYMVLFANKVVSRFQEVTAELHRCLTAIPLVCLNSSDSMRTQVARINGDFRTVRYWVDSQTRHAGRELELVLMENRKGVRSGQEMLLRLAAQLGINSKETVKGEQETLEKAKAEAREAREKQEEDLLGQVVSLLSLVEAEVCSGRGMGRRGDGGRGERRKPPAEYCCPLSLELMAEPVIVASGQTFERAFIERWLEQANVRCPVTRQVLSHTSMIPNAALKSSIATWCKAYGVPIPQPKKLPSNAIIRGPGLVEFRAWKAGDKVERSTSSPALLPRPGPLRASSRRTVRVVQFDPSLDKVHKATDNPEQGTRSSGAERASESLGASVDVDKEDTADSILGPAGGSPGKGETGSCVVSPGGGAHTVEGVVSANNLRESIAPGVAVTVAQSPLTELVLSEEGMGLGASKQSSPSTSSDHSSLWSNPLSPVSVIPDGGEGSIGDAALPQVVVAASAILSGVGKEVTLVGGHSLVQAPGRMAAGTPAASCTDGSPRAPSRRVRSPVKGSLDSPGSTHLKGSSSATSDLSPLVPQTWDRFFPSPCPSPLPSSPTTPLASTPSALASPSFAKAEVLAQGFAVRESQGSPRGPLEHNSSFCSLASSQDEEAVDGRKRGLEKQMSSSSQRSAILERSSSKVEEITIAEEDGFKVLVTTLSRGTEEEKKVAAWTVRKLGKSSEDNRQMLGQLGVLGLLVELLAAEEPSAVEGALFALVNLSISDVNKEKVIANGSLPVVIQLLASENEGIKEGAAALLFSLSVLDEHKVAIAAEGGILGLVDVVVTGNKRARQDAVMALYNLSLIAPNKVPLLLAGVMKPVVYVARKGQAVFGPLMVEKAVGIMANLSSFLEGCQALVGARAIPVLCQQVEGGSPKAREDAAACLLRLAVGSSIHRGLIWKEDIICPLMLLAHSGTTRAKAKAKALLQELNLAARMATSDSH